MSNKRFYVGVGTLFAMFGLCAVSMTHVSEPWRTVMGALGFMDIIILGLVIVSPRKA